MLLEEDRGSEVRVETDCCKEFDAPWGKNGSKVGYYCLWGKEWIKGKALMPLEERMDQDKVSLPWGKNETKGS